MSIKDSYFTISEASKELGVSRQAISRWIAKGKIIAETVGREKLIAKDSLKGIKIKSSDSMLLRRIKTELSTKIREAYHYDEKDKITSMQSFDNDNDMMFRVTRQNGDIDTIGVEFIKYKGLKVGSDLIFKLRLLGGDRKGKKN